MLAGGQQFCLRWRNHHNALVAVLDNLFQKESFVDVILAAEGQFIKVHRIVLSACSQYFEVYWPFYCCKVLSMNNPIGIWWLGS